jgi:hypothetical protein
MDSAMFNRLDEPDKNQDGKLSPSELGAGAATGSSESRRA